jgi:hypothetical protein
VSGLMRAAVGAASAEVVGAVRARIEQAARREGVLVSGLRVRLTEYTDAVAVLAQATAHADGRPIRVQLAAPTLEQALNALVERTRARLAQSAHGWNPRPYPDPDREPLLAPPLVPAPSGSIVRIKTRPLAACPAQVAAAVMDALDYDAHLFTEPDGRPAAVHRAGPTGYRLTRLRPGPPPRQSSLPLVIDPRPAPQLTATAAAARLDRTEAPFLFFAEQSTGRGYLLYRRYDGHYTLLTAAQ